MTRSSSARDRIIKTAGDLFYKNGYRATGINEIIEKSGIAKATFYAHFRSKEELCLVYLKERNERETSLLHEAIRKGKTPLKRFMAFAEMHIPWLESVELRGCGFLNMVPEVPDHTHPIRQEGMRHFETYRILIRQLCEELVSSDKKKYGKFDAQKLAADYLMIIVGGIALSEIHHDMWPMRHAVSSVRALAG